jgi:hypothetical protein
MRISINYGEMQFKENKIWMGTNIISRLTGGSFLALFFGLIIAFSLMGMKGSQWLLLLQGTWFIVGVMMYFGLRYVGAFSDTMLIDKNKKNITVTKHWFFIPVKTTVYLFANIKEVVWRELEVPKKLGLGNESRSAEVHLNLTKNKWLSIAGVSYPSSEKAIAAARDIADRLGAFIGCRVINEKEPNA